MNGSVNGVLKHSIKPGTPKLSKNETLRTYDSG